MRKIIIAALLVFASANAVTTPAALIDCGSLSGRGAVRITIGDVVYRVAIDCGVAA